MRGMYLGVLAMAMILLPAHVRAQATANSAASQTGTITLDVTVSSKSDDAVLGLKAGDFKILDNQQERPITSFRAEMRPGNQPKVILLLDAANVPYQRLSYERQQVDKLLSANNGRLAQPTTLAVLTDAGIQMQPQFTTDGAALRSALDGYALGLRTIKRSAGFYGAVERSQLSLKALKMLIDREAAMPGRKVIVWISPGWPLLGGTEVQLTKAQQDSLFSDIVRLSTEMRTGQIRLDAVNPLGASEDVGYMSYYKSFLDGVRRAQEARIGNLSLQVLAVQSGGIVLNSGNDIAGMIEHCIAQTMAWYKLSFLRVAGEHENEYHQIQVKMNSPGLTAHTSTGYYARPTLLPNGRGTAGFPASR